LGATDWSGKQENRRQQQRWPAWREPSYSIHADKVAKPGGGFEGLNAYQKMSGLVTSRSLYGPRDSPPFEPESVVRAIFTTLGLRRDMGCLPHTPAMTRQPLGMRHGVSDSPTPRAY
jgi:hypothetical protein